MNKLVLTTICAIAFSLSNLAYGMADETDFSEVSIDATSALQATHSMVYTDLKNGMRTQIDSLRQTQESRIFGIDDTKSYADEAARLLGYGSIEG
jgi:hypothetical protein